MAHPAPRTRPPGPRPASPTVLEIAVLGDLHGDFALALDSGLLEPYPVRLCTGDLVPNDGPHRFQEGLRVARELAQAGTYTVLGNHDGPTCFTGRKFPRSHRILADALGDWHVAARRIDLPDLDLSLVGGRPLTCGGPRIRFPEPGREDWSFEQWGELLAGLVSEAACSRVVVLAHCGPTGLGDSRDAIFGCDFRSEAGDWGDLDLRLALDAAGAGRVVAVVAGHMHHALRGGGVRTDSVREGEILHVNAAIVPRVAPDGRRAIGVLRLEGRRATWRIEWRGDVAHASASAATETP